MGEPVPVSTHTLPEVSGLPQVATDFEAGVLLHDISQRAQVMHAGNVMDVILQETQEISHDVNSLAHNLQPSGIAGILNTQDIPDDSGHAPTEDSIEIQVELIQDQQPTNTHASLHQPTATQHNLPPIPVQIYPADKVSTDTETQSLSWTELTLEMLADVVSQQVIRVTPKDELSGNRGNTCYHMTGIKWKDFLDMIIHTHNETCFPHTGVMYNHNTVKIGVTLESNASGDIQGIQSIYGQGRTSVGVQTDLVEKTNVVEVKIKKDNSVQTDPVEKTIVGEAKIKEENVTSSLPSSEKAKEKFHCDQTNERNEDLNDDDDDGQDDINDNFNTNEEAIEEEEEQRSTIEPDSTEKESAFKVELPVKGLPPAQCKICEKRFKSKTALKRHSVVHEPGHNKHPCTFCDKVCKTKCYLERHMATHKKPEKLRKRKPYKRRTDQPQVVKKEKYTGPTTCSICQKTFKFPRNLKRHEKIHAKQDEFPCSHCDKICRSAHYLQLHMMVHADQKQHKCPDCDLSFGRKYRLKQHRSKVHNVHEEHRCAICGNMYKNKETLQDHMIEHNGKKSYLCSTCGKTFNRPSVYRLHLSYHVARSDPKAHKCSLCPKAYHSRSLLNKHIRFAHIKERNYKCSVCGIGFFTRQQQLSHEQVHRERSTHICTFCGKGFAQKHTLLSHSRLHTGYRPFLCRYCNKGFTSKGLLVKHEKIHTPQEKPDRPYQCNQCTAAFSNKTAWADHEKRHAGIKDHKCEFCNVAFVTRGDLTRHLRTHTGGRPFKCQYCDERFPKKLELTEHEVTHGFVEVPITVTLIPVQK